LSECIYQHVNKYGLINFNDLRAIGNGESSRLRDRVGLISLHDGGRSWTVGGVRADRLGRGDPDGRYHGGVVRRRSHIWATGGWRKGWLDGMGDRAGAVRDGQSLACKLLAFHHGIEIWGRRLTGRRRISLRSLGKGSGFWTEARSVNR
jgi:hypothetical protein